MKELVYDSLVSNYVKINFYSPMIFTYDKDFNSSGTDFLECQEFDVYGIGKNISECEKDLADDFIFLWKSYALEDNDILSLDGIKFKEKILKTMKVSFNE